VVCAGVIGVVIINDSDDLYAISGDTNLAYDKSSNVVACVESRDATNDTLKISLLYGARDETFVVSRKALILMEDLSIPVLMIGKTDGYTLGAEVDALGSEDSTVADPLKAKAEKEKREQEKADAHIAWVKETTQEERARERQRLQAEEKTRAHVAKHETQQTKAEGQSTNVSIVFETSRLLSLAADLEREVRDPLSVNRIVFNLVGLSVHQFKHAVEAIFVSLQFYHYQDIRDIPVALEAVSGEASSGVYRLISMDRRFRSPNEEEGGVHVAFDLDPFNTGMEQDIRNDILASYLLMHNLHISVWAQTANRFFSLGVATLPLFVLLRQQRESVLFQGSLPLREPEQSAAKGKALLDGNDKDGAILHLRAVNVGLRPRNTSAHTTSGSERGRISSLLPASRVAPRSQPRQVLGITLPDHEVLQLVRKGLFYDIDAPLDRRNLPFVVEFRDLDGEDAGQLSVLDLSEIEEQIKQVIRDLSVVVRNLQTHGLPYPFPRLADLFEAGLIQDRMTIAFSYKDSTYNAIVLDRGTTIEHKGNTFAFESIDKCVWDVIGHEQHEATDIGMAEMMCYAGTNKDQARSLASIYTEYCQQKVVGQLNRWIPFLRNCVGKTPVSTSAVKQGKSQHKSKSQSSRSKKTSRLEANAWVALGVCAFMHWPLEQDIKHRKALRSGVSRDESRDKEIEWKAIIKATKYLERAADANHACARYNLGLLLEAGFESAQDMVAAQEWILLIASQRHFEKRSLVDFNRDATPRPQPQDDSLDRMRVGCGSQADVARAHLLYAEAGRQGLLRAKCRTELRTIQQACSSADAKRAMQVLASGSQMDPAAMFGMGILHLFHMVQDSNSQQSRSRAFDCFRRASEQGHSRASFNAGICKQLGIGTEQDAAGARNFFRSGARRLEARCIEQLAVSHLETDFPHSHPSTGVRMLQDAWRLGHRRVASKLAALYSEGRAVKQNFELAAAWLAQGDQEVNKLGVLSQQGVAQHATFLQKAPISLSIAMSIVKIHEASVKETIKARLQEGGRRWCLRDVLRALVDRASLQYALACDVITAIAAHNFQGSEDMDKMLEVESLNVVFPFMADTLEQKDSFYGQQQLKQLYGDSLLTRRLRVISTKLFTELSRNFSSSEDAFLRFSRPENRCHVLVGLSLKGLRPGQCDEHWQHRFSRFLECIVQVGLVKYERRKLEVSSLDQEFRLFRQGKPHALFLFDENDFDKRRGFGVPRMRSIVKSARRLIAKPALYGWHGKTLEAVKDPETRLTTYHDLSHPLSVPSAPGGPALSNPVRVGESDLHEMWVGRVGEGSQELYDRSVACGVLTEFGSETPDAALPPIEDYASRVLDDLEWARAHLRYGGTVVIPAPDIDPDQGGAAAGDSRQTVRHSLGRLLPQAYKAALQRELDELMVNACADAVSHRDRRDWLPKGSPFRMQADDGDIQVCSIDILSQHAEYSGEPSTMVLKLQMVTKNALEAKMVGRRLDSLIASGVLTDCLRMHCMPKAHAGSKQPGALSVELNGKTIIMHPVIEANMQQPFIDQPIKLNLLSLPNFMKMLSDLQVCGVCDEGCKERHFGKTCFACGKEYSEHEGHTCPDGGQGFFEVDRLPELIDAKRILFALAGRSFAVSASDNAQVRSQDAAAGVEAGGSPDRVASDGADLSAGKSAVSTSSAQSSEDGAASAPPPPASLESSSSSSVLEPPSEDKPGPPASAAESLWPESAATAKSLLPPETATDSRSPAASKSVLDASKGSEDVPTIAASSMPSQDSGLSKPPAPPQAMPMQVPASPMPSNVFAATARGVKWERVGSERPKTGSEIQNEALAAALKKKLVLSDMEWEKLNLTNLPQDCYIKVDGIYVRAAADDGMDEGATEVSTEAAAKAAKLSAKRRRFLLAQTLQHQVQESNKENAYRPTGDIHGVDSRQFSSFFEVLTESADSVSDWTVVRRKELRANMQMQEAGLISRVRALKEVQQFQKRNATDLNRMVIEDLTKVRHWFPCSWDPASRFFKHELGNPYTNDVEVVISVSGQDLEVLTSAEEHAYCCSLLLNSSKTQSAPIPRRVRQDEDPDEQALAPYQAEDAEKGQIRRYNVALPRGRTVSIFFKYAGVPVVGVPGVPWQVPVKVGPSIESSIRAAQAMYWSRSKVAFHFRETALEILQLEIRPQPIVPSRNFRIYMGQGESKVGLLPFDKRESGKFVKIFSQAASPFIASADVLTKAACKDSKTGMFCSAYIDSGAWLTDSVWQDEADHGALRVFLDASECKDPGQHQNFFCILDRLGNLVAVWSVDVVVLKNYILPDSHDLQLTVPLREFAGDRMHQLSNSPANWQCLVSYFFGVEDGERSDVLQIADSTQKDSVCFKLKNLSIFQTRQCQVRLIDKQSKLCYGSMRMLQNLKKDLARLPSLVQDAAQEQDVIDDVIHEIRQESSEDEQDVDEDRGAEPDAFEPSSDGDLYFEIIIAPAGLRKKSGIKIRINASEVLREDLHKVEELMRLKNEEQEVQPPEWRHVQRKLKKSAGVQSFVYSWRPGAQLTVKNERSSFFCWFLILALAFKKVSVHLIPSLVDLQGSLAVDAHMDTNMPGQQPRLRACAAEL
jgi:TPR repeat protein